MGEITEMMLEGCLCQVCGVYMGDGDGYPVTCPGCAEPDDSSARRMFPKTMKKLDKARKKAKSEDK